MNLREMEMETLYFDLRSKGMKRKSKWEHELILILVEWDAPVSMMSVFDLDAPTLILDSVFVL